MDKDKDVPPSAPFQPYDPFGRGEGSTHSQLCRPRLAVGTLEGMLGAITSTALAKGACAALLTPDRAGDQRRYLLLVQEFLDFNAGKTRREHAERAKEMLEKANVRIFGAALTNAPKDSSIGGYYEK